MGTLTNRAHHLHVMTMRQLGGRIIRLFTNEILRKILKLTKVRRKEEKAQQTLLVCCPLYLYGNFTRTNNCFLHRGIESVNGG